MQYEMSVIVPVYNVAKYLRKCIDSVLHQEGISYEIIIVDDGSTDGSAIICDDYKEQHGNIQVIHKHNEGLGYARNSGLDVANGKYIFFLDSDDWIVDGALSALYALAEENCADMVCFQYVMTPNREYVLAEQGQYKVECVDNYELMKRYIAGISATACTKLYKKEIFDTVRFSNVPIHEDAYSMHLFMEEVNKAVITEQVFYIQYIRQGSLIQSKFEKKNMLCIECGNRIIKFAEEKYPSLSVYAHYNKIERQLYTINLILNSSRYYRYRTLFYSIIKDLEQELSIVNENKNLNQNVYDDAYRLVSKPRSYVIFFMTKTFFRKCKNRLIKEYKNICGKN